MVTAAAQIHAPSPAPRTLTDHDRHMMDYYNGLKLDKLVSLKKEREIDSMFKNLSIAANSNDAQKIRVDIWKELNAIWVENTRHIRQKEAFLYRDPNWKDKTRDRYNYLTRKVAGASDTERLWSEEMRAHIEASAAVLGGLAEETEEYNERIQRTTGTIGLVLKVGKSLFGITPKPVETLVFDQNISPTSYDYLELKRLEDAVIAEITPKIQPEVNRVLASTAEQSKMATMSEKQKASYKSEKTQQVRKQLIWDKIKDSETLHKLYAATFDSNFGADLGTTYRAAPPILRKDLGTKLADALMNFPDPFKNFTYRNIMNWIDEKIK
jgi:hypothetical protein